MKVEIQSGGPAEMPPKERGTRTALLASSMLILVSLGGGLALWSFASGAGPGSNLAWPTTDSGTRCDYSLALAQNVPVAVEHGTGVTKVASPGEDFGAFFNGLISSNKSYCVAAGAYSLTRTIRVTDQKNATFYFAPGARITTHYTVRMFQIIRSSGILVEGGAWVGPGQGIFAGLEVDLGSSNITIRGTDVSRAGHDGILIRNDTEPNLRVSILDNYLHDNGRYGAQAYEHFKTDSLRILFSGNTAVDNWVGGIYTNRVGGAVITSNTVRNSVGTTPGLIGIGVTNGENDSVTFNRVDHMYWYGIQAFYNNYTTITNNFSAFNSGGSDQSGITNDHSFYDTISNNTVISNGLAGVHVERSWFVTVQGNTASGNGRFGIEFYHGDMPTTGMGKIVGNQCSYNGQVGIILNSGVNTLISGNSCLDNSGSGILLYNDRGQAGSSGNTITHNLLGDDRSQPSERTQLYGIRETNQADHNAIASNVFFNNSASSIVTSGPSTTVTGNIEDSKP